MRERIAVKLVERLLGGVCALSIAVFVISDTENAVGAPARVTVRTLSTQDITRSELREILLSGDSQPSASSPAANDALVSFYAARDFRPVWTGSTYAEDMAAGVRAALLQADRQGLRYDDYAEAASRWNTPAAGREAAEYDISLTKDLLHYVTDVHTGRVQPTSVYKDVNLPRADFDATAALTLALRRDSVREFLADLPPVHPEYRALAEALSHYRAISAKGGWSPLSGQSEITLEASDPRLKSLAARLSFEDPVLAATSKPSVSAIQEAIKRFQKRHGLEPDGRIGPSTLAELNVPASFRAAQIAANMERWRWLPPAFEHRYVRVNIPDQSVNFVQDGNVVLTSPVIIGRKTSPTPILRTQIYTVVTSPPWNIPDDIVVAQILPQLRKNAHYLAAQNMVLVNGPVNDPQGLRINWRNVDPAHFPYGVRQIPGPNSVLGLLMLDSPNDFDVYLHDTPGKKLFDGSNREISNGCVRVKEIFALASLALTNDTENGLGRLKESIALGDTRRINLDNPLPVYMLYWTAIANDDGTVEFRPDRYGRDRPLIAALAGTARARPERSEPQVVNAAQLQRELSP